MKQIAFVALPLVVTLASSCKTDQGKSDEKPSTQSASMTKSTEMEKKTPTPTVPAAPPQIPAPSDVAAPPADAEKTASGLASKMLKAGAGGDHPTASDTVVVHYTGWTTDGKMFDSSKTRGEPARFPLGRVIKGWTEGLQLMTKGESRRLWVPEELAYKGLPGRPAGMLVFDVELIDIIAAPKPPEDVAKAPKTAKKTASGLAYRVLDPGKGTEHPKANSVVTVQYSGWTTDGKMFDTSITRGRPATFPLDRVIPGWTEALQLMVQGEKTRFWIPEELAYKGQQGAPQGTLVFDVELLDIKPPAPPPSPAPTQMPGHP